MSNPRNLGTVIGRLAADPAVFTNKDGSKSVKFSVYADRNYTNAAGKRESDAVPVEAFVRATVDGLGPYASIHSGDLVAVNYAVRLDRYIKDNKTVYETKLAVEDITFLESRTVTQARLNDRVQAAAAQNEAAAPAAQPAQAAAAPAAQAALPEQLPFG